MATAALECGCHQKAAPLVKAVLAKFPESLRAKRLQASRRALGSAPRRQQQQQQQQQQQRAEPIRWLNQAETKPAPGSLARPPAQPGPPPPC